MTDLLYISEYEAIAKDKLPKPIFDYYCGGADEEITLRRNTDAFSRFIIQPKMMVDVSKRQMGVSLLNGIMKIKSPICIAPTASQRMAHPDGELATARAAAAENTLLIASTIATTSLEDSAKANGPNGLRWFQLYVFRDRQVTTQLVKRAELAGYKAIVLTVDTPVGGNRRRDVRNGFSLPEHLTMANFTGTKAIGMTSEGSGASGFVKYVNSLFDPTLSWKDVDWLKSLTHLPVIVKGILHPLDAIEALKHGVDAIIVSNHGGRQLDTVPATIEVLPMIVRAVAGRCDVYVDGGIRSGNDAFKALALGANAVFIGRPIIWGLAAKGEEGVKNVLKMLNNELDITMTLSGCDSLTNIEAGVVMHEDKVPKICSKL